MWTSCVFSNKRSHTNKNKKACEQQNTDLTGNKKKKTRYSISNLSYDDIPMTITKKDPSANLVDQEKRPSKRKTSQPKTSVEITGTAGFVHSEFDGKSLKQHQEENAIRLWSDQSVEELSTHVKRNLTLSEESDAFVKRVGKTKNFARFVKLRKQCFEIISEFCDFNSLEARTMELAWCYAERVMVEDRSVDVRLTAIAACLLACKIDEIWPPHIDNFIEASGCTHKKLRKRELELLEILGWHTSYTTPSDYLQCLGGDECAYMAKHRNGKKALAAAFFIEIGRHLFFECGSSGVATSLEIAAAAVVMSQLINGDSDGARYSVMLVLENMSVDTLKASLSVIYKFVSRGKDSRQVHPIFKKYSTEKWGKVGKLSLPKWTHVQDFVQDIYWKGFSVHEL